MRKMVLLRWSVGAVGASSVPGGAVGGERFGVLRFGEGRVPSRDYVGRGKVPVAGEKGVRVGRRLVGRRRAGRRRAGRQRAGRRVGQQPPPWHVAGDGAPRCAAGPRARSPAAALPWQRRCGDAADATLPLRCGL